MKTISTLMLALIISTTIAQVEPEKAMWDLQNIIGEWRTETDKKGKYTSEIWQPDSIGLAGTGMQIKGDKTVFEEFLRISIREGTLYYSAQVPNQNKGAWIDFAMTEHSENSWLFENPAHDFPKKICYTIVDENSLTVHVSGSDGGFELNLAKKK